MYKHYITFAFFIALNQYSDEPLRSESNTNTIKKKFGNEKITC